MQKHCATCGGEKFLTIGQYEKCANCFRPYLGIKKLIKKFVGSDSKKKT